MKAIYNNKQGLYKDMTYGKIYDVIEIIEGCDCIGHGSALPWKAYQIKDDAGDIVLRSNRMFREYSKEYYLDFAAL